MRKLALYSCWLLKLINNYYLYSLWVGRLYNIHRLHTEYTSYLLFIRADADPSKIIEENTYTVVRKLVAKTIFVGIVNPFGDE